MAVKLNNKMRALLLLATLAMASATPQTVSFHSLNGFGALIRRERRSDAVARGGALGEGWQRRFIGQSKLKRTGRKNFSVCFCFLQSARHVPRRDAQPRFASSAPTWRTWKASSTRKAQKLGAEKGGARSREKRKRERRERARNQSTCALLLLVGVGVASLLCSLSCFPSLRPPLSLLLLSGFRPAGLPGP